MDSETETSRLLHRWNAGDEQALHRLLVRHLPAIRATVARRLGERLRQKATPSDYVQDTALEILRWGPRFKVSDASHFRRLLARIIENVLRGKHDWFTARRRDMAREQPLPPECVIDLDPHAAGAPPADPGSERLERQAWVRLGLELLDPSDREVLVLRQWDRLGFGQIGERLAISEEAARKRGQRALVRLGRIVGTLRRGGLLDVVGAEEAAP